jgi:Bax protein
MTRKGKKMHSRFTTSFISLIFLSMLLPACTDQDDAENTTINDKVIRTIESTSYKDVVLLFNEIGYTSERWQAGIREIPRIEITNIPERWQKISQTIPVKVKKSIFFRLIGSGVLIANEKITLTRNKLLDVLNKNNIQNNKWLHALAIKYKVIKEKDEAMDKTKLDELLKRVDIIPASLALAQGAEESGWGTSRFAIQGNSLFGQWDFSGNGIKPENQRAELGNYGIAAYDTPQASVDAYMLNLNTHRAYQRLRDKRAESRKQNKEPTGWDLAETLDKYSERGDEYVKGLHALMDYNKLNPADDAYLWDKGKIVISPVP